MSNRLSRKNSLSSKKLRRRRSELERSRARRNLRVESLEERRLLAVGPELLEIQAAGEEIEDGDIRYEPFNELLFRFDSDDAIAPSTLDGFQIGRAGANGIIGDGDDIVVTPGFRGIGNSPNEVILRFAETLPDDVYGIHVDSTVTNQSGLPFNNGADLDVEFTLDRGTQVISVVPQPVVRDPDTGELSQAEDQVIVYFDSDQLDPAIVTNPAFYQLTDEVTGDLLFPQEVQYSAETQQAVLIFAEALPGSTFHLEIGTSDEPNDTLDSAINSGTISQRAPFNVFESPIILDSNGDPLPTPILDNDTAISRITVNDLFLVQDVEVEIDMDHDWSPDLRVFLVGPEGDRVELIRDVSVDVLGGQIYGTKFDDIDGDGVQDEDEPGLSGWTIYIDDNRNSVLDPSERSTVTDAAGNYSFVGLALGADYRIAEVPQPLWQQTSPSSGGREELFQADFSDGALQVLRVTPDPIEGDPTEGTFRLDFGTWTTDPIEYAGQTATTAANIEVALEAITDPGVDVTVTSLPGSPIEFEVTFALLGVGTPVDHPILSVVAVALDYGSMAVATTGSDEGFVTSGATDLWHVTIARGDDTGHTGQQSFYFGEDETEDDAGSYPNNADGTLTTPTIDLRDQRITGRVFLDVNHFLDTEDGFDFANIDVIDADGNTTNLFNSSTNTSGFAPLSLELTPFIGRVVSVAFTFNSDFVVTNEGWFVDDVRVSVERGVQDVTLSEAPQGGILKNIDFGGLYGIAIGPDAYGYEAFVVGADFEDIVDTGKATLQKSVGSGFAVQAGGTEQDDSNSVARDAAGNLYITGSFLGSATFGEGGDAVTLNAVGNSDIFIAKYTSEGVLLWAIGMGGDGSDSGADVEVDAAGNVFVTGRFSASVDFDPGAGDSTLTSNGGSDAFVARYTTDGDLDWVDQFGGAFGDAGNGVDVDAAGNVAVTGYFSGVVDFNPGAGAHNLASAGDNDIFVVRLSAAGNLQYAQRYGSTGTDQGRAVTHDALGRLIVVGSFAETVDFNPGVGVLNLTSSGLTDGFVVAINGSTTYWAKKFGGTAAAYGTAVAIDSGNNVIVAGTRLGNATVRKYADDGSTVFFRTFGGAATDVAEDVAVDSNDNIFVTGSFRQEVDFYPGAQEAIHTSVGGRDVFVSRFSPAGTFDLVRVSGSVLDDVGTGLAVNAENHAIYTGVFRDAVDIHVGPTATEFETITSAGNSDAFLAELAIVEGLDDAAVHLTVADLAGFEFQFYGVDYDELYYSSNGLITFGSENISSNNNDLTDPPPQAAIAVFWDDLVTGSGDREAVFWEIRGSGDDQRLIIQWNGVHLASAAGFPEGPLNFQAVLSEWDNSIQLNYETVTGPLLIDSGVDQRIGTFGTGQQDSPAIATDEDGNYVVVWTADGQDGSGLAIYGRRFNADSNPLTGEFRINSTTAGDQANARVAMNADGRFVVVWDTDQADVFAQIYNAAGGRVGGQLLVHSDTTGTQRIPDVVIDSDGNFVVTWSGEGADDADGVYARRFDANGVPLGTVDEVQRLEILGPPAATTMFSLQLGAATTAPISFPGFGNSLLTARNIQTALRALPTTGNQIRVIPITSDEVQTITFTGDPASGDFTLDYNGEVTAAIVFEGAGLADDTATNIQDALRLLPSLSDDLTVVAVGDFEYVVSFLGTLGAFDHPLLVADDAGLDQGAIAITETVKGASSDETLRFDVLFVGQDGRQDQPLLVHVDRLNGVTHLLIEEIVQGDNGEFRVNNHQVDNQDMSRGAIDDDGNFVIVWQSENQDSSNSGIFGKRYDAAGVAQSGDADEVQQISLLGPPTPGSTYRLRFAGQLTSQLDYTGGNAVDAAVIQAELRALPNLSNSVLVSLTPGDSDEVQLINFTVPDDTTGTFVLSHAGLFTTPIDFAGTNAANGLTTAGDIEDALRALPNLSDSVTVVPAIIDSAREFIVTFTGPDGGIDQPLLFVVQESLSAGSMAIDPFNDGGHSVTDFIVEFLGLDGRQNQPAIQLADNTGGVIGMTTTTLVEGAGCEFPVNEITLDNQMLPSIATDATGRFLVVWQGQDQDDVGVIARLFDADGTSLTGDFQVNTYTEANQHEAEAIFDSDGNFVITWRSDGQEGQAGEVYARQFGPDAAPLGDELPVNLLTAGDQFEPAIAARPSGEFVVAFASQAGSGGVHTLRFAPDGTPLDAAEVQVSQFGTPSQYAPVVARNTAGDFVVVWNETVRDATLDPGIYAQTFFADGTPRSGEIAVPQTTANLQDEPDVAIDEAGNFVVTWTTFVETAEETTDWDVMARRFGLDGVALDDEFTVNTLVGGFEYLSRVDMDAVGNFTIVWESSDPTEPDIKARRFEADGTAIDADEFTVNSLQGAAIDPAIDVNASGAFVVVWTQESIDASSSDIFAQQFAADGTPVGDEFAVNQNPAAILDAYNDVADVGIEDDGSFVVVWQYDNAWMEVLGRRFDSDGLPEGDDFLVQGIIPVIPEPRIAMDSGGLHVVTWAYDPLGIQAQRYSAAGVPVGGVFRVSDATGGTYSHGTVSTGPNGEFIVGWLDEGQGGERVMVERFTAENPSVGIKAEGTQAPWENLLPLWVDGAQNPFVGSGLSTKILVVEQVRQAVFALDVDTDEIHQLDPDTAAIVHSIPLPSSVTGDTGLAFAGDTLYLVSDDGLILYELDPATGAIVDTTVLADLGITEPVNSLAFLNGQVVVQDAANDLLHFIDPFEDALVATVTTGVSLKGGLAGAGSRGTLFAVDSIGDVVEIDPADGSMVNSFASPGVLGVGLAFLEGHLWVGDSAGEIVKLDPDTGAEVDSWSTAIPLTGLGADDGGAIQTAVVGNFRPFVGTILDDEADIPITAGEGPFTGRFVPIESLSLFDNQAVTGMWTLEIQDTATGDEGELFGWKLIVNDMEDTPADFLNMSNIGNDSPNGVNDIDLYRIDVLSAGVILVEVAPSATLDSVVRLFDATGAELAIVNAPGLGMMDRLMVSVPDAGSYVIGISSSANTAYSPLDGSGAADGSSTGSYGIAISFDQALVQDDDNSSFDSATDFGVLGLAGQTSFGRINNAPMNLNMPGSILEPGHRDIPAESHYLSGGYSSLSFVPDRLLIGFTDQTSVEDRDAILAARGLEIVQELSGALVVESATGIDVLKQANELMSNQAIDFVEPDYLLHTTAVFPNDTSFPQLWGMNNTGQAVSGAGGTADADIDAPEAWEITTGSPDTVIAVIDTGVDYTHPDLQVNMWVNPGEVAGDGIDNDGNGFIDDIYGIDTANNDSDPMDGNAHGTHVSGTIAGAGDNGAGVVGVNWQAQIMALKFLPDVGGGSTADAIEAIDYMTMMKTQYGINIVASNNSWGGGGFSTALRSSIQSSIDAGIIFIAAAGNDGQDTDANAHYPSSYDLDGIISVAASDPDDKLATFPDFGSTFDSNFGATTVDVAAPGVSILSTTPGNTYSSFGGTSMAAPHVTGVIGLLASVAPNASVQDLKNAILDGADLSSALTGKVLTGARLNAFGSLALIGAGGSSTPTSVPTAYYNFQDNYGVLPTGDIPQNVITENQKERTREVFEYYGDVLGISFVESADTGLTVVTGDLRAVAPNIPTGPGGVAGISEGTMGGRVIMDAAEDWGISEYGGGWFNTAMHEIGHSLGLGHAYDLPNLTIMGGNSLPGTPPAESIFPGNADIIHGQFLYPTAANDVDLYQFEVPESGQVRAEIIAERMTPSSSLLDASLTLYQETTGADGPVREVIARNDDYYSSDSLLDLWLDAGTYYVAVTSTGNEGFNPTTSDTGFGGTTEGLYHLNLSFLADSASTLVDSTLTQLDGDADGAPGGDFDFWFQSGPTIFVDKMNDATTGNDGDGSLADPYDTISAAVAAAASRIVVPPTGGAAISDGDQFVLSDGVNPVLIFEFDQDAMTLPGNLPITFDAADSPDELALAIADAINGADDLNITATTDGAIVLLDQVDLLDVRGTVSLLTASNPVRIVANPGEDGSINTINDNVPYLLGVDDQDLPLADGAGLFVPQGVTVMIDSGALLKLMAANLDAGTSALGVNRGAGALQILGTPEATVDFRSYHNDGAGGDSDGPGEAARPGNWGGLVFRDDSDMEQDGIFLNWVNFADINNGGGKVLMDSVEQNFTPVDMISARPTISHTVIRHSADAAMAADPNSFDDSLGRIGPDIHDNLIVENSINGLFIRIRTELGETLNRLDVPARWNDTDIVHVVTENLLIGSTPGGPSLNDATGDFDARLDARLRIDPGVIVKLEGSRIEGEMSSQFIAEGTAGQPITMTALKDDRFGGSGTFDTSNDLDATTPQPGQWGGLFFNAISKASLDHTLITFAGGLTPIEGGFDQFVAIEAHQAELRVTNSVLTQNETGQASSNRTGRGGNQASTIFVRGAQPILVNNQIRDNAGPAITIDANSLKADFLDDWGRGTGLIDAYAQWPDNHGPLVRMNLLDNNAINGMVVRGQVLTAETVWDDTDIAHVLFGEVILLNHHTFSGLQFQSSDRESLVVKLGDPAAGFTADGQPLDIIDRIGGSIHVLGTPAYPVIFTSLSDDSVAAGVALDGSPLGDTNNDGPSTGTPGDWRGIRLDRYSNDRNVEVLLENEPVYTTGEDLNDVPSSAQFLGVLAPDLKSGDSNRRLGFEVQGFIAPDDPTDLDVYSFDARGRTEIWIDIDRTGAALDAIVELTTADGTILASSYDNDTLGGLANGLIKDVWRGSDFFTIDTDDPGMRVVLPGDPDVPEAYYVRVRSQPEVDQESDLDAGLTTGGYELQIRLQQIDENPGSTIRNADIYYATNAIEILGMPAHSPLAGETGESTIANDTIGSAQQIGNVLASDRNVISVGGDLSARTDVDWYHFTLDYDLIQAIGGVNGGGKTWSTIFDIDYADGLSRPDTTISVFDASGNLILVSRDSNIEDDQPGAGQGADTDDLTRGSFGTLDSFIGSVQMPAGIVPAGTSAEYYVAISSNYQLASAMSATFDAGSTSSLVRLEPVNSVTRIAEDHIGFDGHMTGTPAASALVEPEQSLFDDIGDEVLLDTHILPFTLSDVVLYVSTGGSLWTADPSTGVVETRVGTISPGNGTVLDIAMRSDGRLYGAESVPATANTAGSLVQIDWSDGSQSGVGNDGIPDYNATTNPPNPQQLTSGASDALAYTRTGFDTGANAPTYALFYAVNGIQEGGVFYAGSTLYRANPATGSAAVAQNQPWGRRGGIYDFVPGDVGTTTGMAFAAGQLYGVSDNGLFYSVSTGTGQASNVVDLGFTFTGLTTGPQNLDDGSFADTLFAIDSGGTIYALDTAGQLQSVFAGGATSVDTNLGGANGLAFSPADFNPWHPTMERGTDPGHGVNDSFDQSRPSNVEWIWNANGRSNPETEGGASFSFGFEGWQQTPSPDYYYTYGANAQYGLLSTNAHRDLSSNTAIAGSYNLPGGALGSLATSEFSLDGYAQADKPTLYFNYFLETQDANSAAGEMRDSFRVLASTDGGVSWGLLATNNSVLNAELPVFISASANASSDPRQLTQELFDNTGGWRQARVDLSEFVGNANIQLRFDFSTAGTMDQRVPGDSYGNFSDEDRAQQNNFEGAYIDDVIIGFAERGEMVTGPSDQNDFFAVPQGGASEVLVGPYQLEIRRGTEYGANVSGTGPEIAVFRQYDTNVRMVESLLRLGDQNVERQQGHIQIETNTIRFASEYGIVVDAGLRDATGDVPHPGAVRNLPTLNSDGLVYGLSVQNNVIAESGLGGILFSGDSSPAGIPSAVVPYGQILNNTIYGAETPVGAGITVQDNASPTILNNIVANQEDGILVDGSSSSTVLGANLFQSNTNNGATGSNAIFLAPDDPLFVDPAVGNFYLALDSQAIDSSLNRLDDRPEIVAVTSPLAIPPAPIVAPERDRFGQLRIDDPMQAPPPGLGSNIFKDRGAVERADFAGPFAVLSLPDDNNPVTDLDPVLGSVLVEDWVVSDFEIQINDDGIGVDDSSVVSSNVTLILNGRILLEGTDYIFRYDPNGDAIRLDVRAEVPQGRNVYEIALANDAATGIRDLAANGLRANYAPDLTRFTVTTAGLNDAPDAIDDSYVVDEGALLAALDANGSIPGTNDDSVLLNDTDADFDALTAQLLTAPQYHSGTFVLNPNGTFSYQHDGSETTSDSFTYLAVDELGEVSFEATVTIVINPVNDLPVATFDAYTVDEGARLDADDVDGSATPSDSNDDSVAVNDFDEEGDAFTVELVTNPTHASSFVLNADGTFVYQHDGSETLEDTFEYKLIDINGGESAVATVTITISPINDAPVTVDDQYTVDEGGVLAADDVDGTVLGTNDDGVLVNDSDAELDVMTAELVDPPQYHAGTFTLNADGTFTYQHDGSETLADSFTYQVRDAAGDVSRVTTVQIDITPINDPPVAVDDAYGLEEGATLIADDPNGFGTPGQFSEVGVLANDFDGEDDAMTAILVTAPAHAAFFELNDDGTFVYRHDGSETTLDTFEYKITDGADESNVALVTLMIVPVNDPPVANDDNYTVAEGQLLLADDVDSSTSDTNDDSVLANDSDPEAEVLTASLVSSPQHHFGIFTLNADGTFDYLHNGSETSSDMFTYEVTDASGAVSGIATVHIEITPVNDAPIAVDDSYSVDEGSILVVDDGDGALTPSEPADDGVLVNDAEPEGDVMTAVLVSGPSYATFFTLNEDGTFTYEHDGSEASLDSFEYQVTDGNGGTSNTATVSLTINPIDDPPIAVDDVYSSRPGQTFTTTDPDGTATEDDRNDDGVLANDSDAEGAVLTAVLVDGPLHATAFVLNDDGTFSYTPDGSAPESDTFTYFANDGGLDSDLATVTIVFTDPPVAQDDESLVLINTTTVIDVLANDGDPDGTLDPSSIVIELAPSHGVVVVMEGEVEYTPDVDYLGTDFFEYSVADDSGARSNIALVHLAVVDDLTPWTNPGNNYDVNADGLVSPWDALIIINYLHFNGPTLLPVPPTAEFSPPPYFDVTGDNAITPVDALQVINALNRSTQSGGAGEGAEGEYVPASDRGAVPAVSLASATSVNTVSGETPVFGLLVDPTASSGSERGYHEVADVSPQGVEDELTVEPLALATDQPDRQAAIDEIRSRNLDDLDDWLDDIAEDIAEARDEELLSDLALSGLLKLKGDA